MAKLEQFTGFPKELLTFYEGLAANNERIWFENHRHDYERHVLAPARAFVVELGERLRMLTPGVHADPRIDKTIFRIFRDTRFSRDKRPYKTHLGLWFWDGDRGRMECSGFYLQIEPGTMFLGAGVYQFPRDLIETYRRAVVDKKRGAALTRAVEKVLTDGRYRLGEKHYKRVPRGYDPDHRNAELLKHSGLHVGFDAAPPKALHSAKFLDYCFEHFHAMLPLHLWLREVVERT